MSELDETVGSGETPTDRRIDRRGFMTRMAAAGAAATAVPFVAESVAQANPLPLLIPNEDIRLSEVSDLTELTLAQAATLIWKFKLSPVDLVEAHLERIAKFDGTYKAFNTVLADQALARAKTLSKRLPQGPLHGIPLAIKDNYYTQGVKTTANSYIFENFVPDYDATAVERLRRRGAIVLGKTQMGPLATTRATTPDGIVTTVNAWTPQTPSVDPGGSSSGSATATAGRMACSSIGTQTGGSITAPSNAQGLTGLKPTHGRVSAYGVIPLTYSRDHPGPLARDAKDAAYMLQVMCGPDPNDPRTLGLPSPPNFVTAATPFRRGGKVQVRYRTKLGVLPGYTSGSTPTALARKAMLDALANVGVDVVDVTLPAEWDLLTGTAFNNVRLPERTEPFLDYMKQDLKLFGVSLGSWMQGLFMSGDEWVKGQRAKFILLQRVLDDLFGQCDAVVQTGPVPFDILGLPELALPIGFQPNATAGTDIPIGAIIGGQPYAEDRLLAIAAAYQAVTDWHTRRPADPVAPAATLRGLRDAAPAEELTLSLEDVIATTQ